jgi:monoamine oxidase
MDLIAKALEQPVKRHIHYSTVVEEIRQTAERVTVAFRDSAGVANQISADYCICTVPLSVLVNLPMDVDPHFKAAMRSCSYAPVNKVGLQMKQRFWERSHEIYGGHVQINTPGVGIISLPSTGWNGRKGVVRSGDAATPADAVRISAMTPIERIQHALAAGEEVFPGEFTANFESGYAMAWHLNRYSLGAWSSWSEEGRKRDYPKLCEPDGRIYLAGEHLTYLNGWQAGAIESAWQQIAKLHQRVQQT